VTNNLSAKEYEKDYEKGVALATLSYVIWGVLPIYWKAMEPVSPLLIMLYRLVMAFIFVLVLAFIFYKPREIMAPLKQKRAILIYFASGCLISLNWGIYIWAVNSGQILQTSMGYYINPLITVRCAFLQRQT
jgi:chloramphenicol-sensitive protein RarD